jgi:hypothetical protein
MSSGSNISHISISDIKDLQILMADDQEIKDLSESIKFSIFKKEVASDNNSKNEDQKSKQDLNNTNEHKNTKNDTTSNINSKSSSKL